MKVLDAHRNRVAELRAALESLFAIHGRLSDLRSESWREQSHGGSDRAETLAAVGEQIDALELEAAQLRAVLVIHSRQTEN
ncbi:MAG: hypothetical protein IH988_05330 [Planctomycetes bacterium]|nr:hypothetical protein [Planctomycetota bacterium]